MTALRRRSMKLLGMALLVPLAACGQPGATAGGSVPGGLQPPSLDQIKQWAQLLSQELPSFVTDLQATGTLTGTRLTQANQTIARFQSLVTTLLQMGSGTDPTTVLNDIAGVVVTVLTFFPQTAPFIPLVAGLQLLIAAFINSVPTSLPTPTPTTVASMHAATRRMAH